MAAHAEWLRRVCLVADLRECNSPANLVWDARLAIDGWGRGSAMTEPKKVKRTDLKRESVAR